MLPQPPYALAPVVFPLRALAALAGRLPLGGEREVAMTLLVGARLADGCTARYGLDATLRKARLSGAKHWCGAMTLPAPLRAAALQVAEASTGESRDGVAAALERLMTLGAHVLDAPSRAELRQLLAALRTA